MSQENASYALSKTEGNKKILFFSQLIIPSKLHSSSISHGMVIMSSVFMLFCGPESDWLQVGNRILSAVLKELNKEWKHSILVENLNYSEVNKPLCDH